MKPLDERPDPEREPVADQAPRADEHPVPDRRPVLDKRPVPDGNPVSGRRPAPPPAVEYGSLILGRRLGEGGRGAVHELPHRRIDARDSGSGGEVVFQEYDDSVLPQLDADALAAQVALLGEVGAAEGDWLREKTAWPTALVRRHGRTCGFLMRDVPDRFRSTGRTVDPGGRGERRLAVLDHLLEDDTRPAGTGPGVGDRERLLLLADLATALGRLHGLGIAVGDLSPRNLLFSLSPRPECFLIDCDAMRVRGVTALPQPEAPDWRTPAGEEKATPASDVHRLGLLAVRLFARDRTATDPAVLAAAGPAVVALARASLDPDPARRPTPAAWAEALIPAAAARPAGTFRPHGTIRVRPPGTGRPASAPVAPGASSSESPPGSASSGDDGTSGTVTPPPARAGWIGAVVGVLVLVAAVVVPAAVRDHDDTAAPAARQPVPAPVHTSATPRPLPTPPPPRPTPPPAPTPTDPIALAEVGDCFYDRGSGDRADLSATACGAGTFKVVRINANTTDLTSCDDVPDNTEAVSSSRNHLVLCLSYQSSGGTAFHAHQGDCVYGAPGATAWGKQACQSGNFKVLAVYRGTSDHAKCTSWPHYNYWRHMPVSGDPKLDVLLCLSMNYPDDAGYATLDECLSKAGSTFTNVGSCGASNVYVTGRTGTANDWAFCGRDGATSWRSTDYPDFAYTVCWRWR
ncbi:hypothetical protein ACIRD3_05930 [Kitasatospora sp. NPDC093550]|uniref:LppU/SCO3897 family protein n=1 Tax=Kitasatospora sp. NPDC093550 TaxID=3364089 RepID=UPI00382D0813